ncbi:MAG: hypothetical protein SVX43_09370 [Cyanobacteriota bacterium]|nr:hypothetical protein [Cyanobacteriota bacterium]
MLDDREENKTFLATTTGEPHQLARIYYKVFNQKTVLNAFKKLRCMDFDRTQNRWVWLYEAEAKKLRFDEPHHKIPKEMHPIVIGYFIFRENDEMLLELRSLDRAIQALEFFDKRINRHAAQATKIRVLNKLFSVPSNREDFVPPSFEEYFDRADLFISSSEEIDAEFDRIAAEHEDEESRMAALTTYMEEQSKKPLPETEEIPINIYEDGLLPLTMSLKLRQVEAFQHWLGNTSFSQHDILQSMMNAIAEEE